jgi:hypothetical protein
MKANAGEAGGMEPAEQAMAAGMIAFARWGQELPHFVLTRPIRTARTLDLAAQQFSNSHRQTVFSILLSHPWKQTLGAVTQSMNCNLNWEDCAEIYHALGLAHAASVQVRIGDHGKRLAKGWMTLGRDDAETIFRALVDKRERVRQGNFDSHPGECNELGSIPFLMAERIAGILAKIGPLGENLTVENPEYRRSENPDAAIQELRASLLAASTGVEQTRPKAGIIKSASRSRKFFASIASRVRVARPAE